MSLLPVKQKSCPRRNENLSSTFILSKHATLRMAQRNISLRDLEYVLKHGEHIYRTGVAIYILRKRDILQRDRKTSKITRLEGTVVLTGFLQDGTREIITIYRNKSAHKEIRSKAKYDKRSRYRTNRDLSLNEWLLLAESIASLVNGQRNDAQKGQPVHKMDIDPKTRGGILFENGESRGNSLW